MADLAFAPQHNMIAYLEKTKSNAEFHQIVDFLISSSIHHSLTVSPTIYSSNIEQFWNYATSQTINNEKQIHATVDGDRVFLKVSPARGVRRFGIKGKLSPRFIRPFKILDRVGEVSYRLALPSQLSHVHNVFYVSLLRGYKYHPLHVVSYPLDQIRADLSYVEEPEAILDRQDRVMRNKTIPFVKILWRNHLEREATWETEESIRTSYPYFLL
nr:hypothetical protein [Tanacetum cinerariifolium]